MQRIKSEADCDSVHSGKFDNILIHLQLGQNSLFFCGKFFRLFTGNALPLYSPEGTAVDWRALHAGALLISVYKFT